MLAFQSWWTAWDEVRASPHIAVRTPAPCILDEVKQLNGVKLHFSHFKWEVTLVFKLYYLGFVLLCTTVMFNYEVMCLRNENVFVLFILCKDTIAFWDNVDRFFWVEFICYIDCIYIWRKVVCFVLFFVSPCLVLSVASWGSVSLAVFFFIVRMEISLLLWKIYSLFCFVV
jgi:hypothetical protein